MKPLVMFVYVELRILDTSLTSLVLFQHSNKYLVIIIDIRIDGRQENKGENYSGKLMIKVGIHWS